MNQINQIKTYKAKITFEFEFSVDGPYEEYMNDLRKWAREYPINFMEVLDYRFPNLPSEVVIEEVIE